MDKEIIRRRGKSLNAAFIAISIAMQEVSGTFEELNIKLINAHADYSKPFPLFKVAKEKPYYQRFESKKRKNKVFR